MDPPKIEPVIRIFDIFLILSPNKLLNRQLSCRWFEKPWRPFDVSVMGSKNTCPFNIMRHQQNGEHFANDNFKGILLGENPWWRHEMETFTALLDICAGNSPVPGEFPAQRPVTRSFDVFFDLRLNKRLSKQLWGWWFETLSRPLWRHCNDYILISISSEFVPKIPIENKSALAEIMVWCRIAMGCYQGWF